MKKLELEQSGTSFGKTSFMAKAIMLYFISMIFGVMAIPFLSGSVLKYIALFILLGWVMNQFPLRISKFSVLFLVYLGLMAFALAYTINTSATLTRIESNALFVLILIAASSVCLEKFELDYIKKALIWSSRIAAGMLLVTGITSADRLLLNTGVIVEDPNYLNGYFLFGLVNAIQMLMTPKKKYKIFYVLEIFLYIYCCLASGSRGGLFCLIAAAVVMLFLYTSGQKGAFGKNLAIKLGIVAAAVVIFLISTQFLPEAVMERFTLEAIQESDGTGRYDLWERAISIFGESNFFHKLFGYGPGAIRDIFEQFGFVRKVAHNIYIEQLVEGGLLLDLVYLAMIVYLFVKSWKRRDIFSFSIVAGMVVLSLSTSLYAFKPFWAIMMFINLTRVSELDTAEKPYQYRGVSAPAQEKDRVKES